MQPILNKKLFQTYIRNSTAIISIALFSSAAAHADTLIMGSDQTINSHSYESVLVEEGTLTGSNLTITSAEIAALLVTGGGQANLTNTVINTSGYNAFAVDAIGTTVKLSGADITTSGERGYGLLAEENGLIEANANISTSGFKAHGVQAGGGTETLLGTVKLTGGTVKTTGSDAYGLHAVYGGIIDGTTTITTEGTNAYGAFAESGSAITLDGASIRTSGNKGYGLLVNNDDQTTGGKITANNVDVLVSGADTEVARIENNAEMSVSNSRLEAKSAAGVALVNEAKFDITGSTIVSAQQSFVSHLDRSGQTQTINLGQGSVATQNNGTLLLVIRNTDGADGEVKFTVTAGAVAQGDIIDLDTRTTGGTDVTIEENAVWSGALQGVRHFTSLQKGTVNFNGETNISGDLSGNGATYNFSSSGGNIGGKVNLTNNSRTSGGTINTLIAVGGDVNVDQTSVFGGNWSIAGDLSNQGVLSPGNAIGVIKIGGSLNLTGISVYEVNIDPNGGADMVSVDGTAELAGNIIVKPLNGFNLTSPYKILTANNIHGQFSGASFEKPTDFLNSFLHYSDNSVTLIVDRNNTSFSSAAQTSNQASVANALDHMPLSNPIVATIALSSREDARRAFDPLSGEIHASVMTGLIEDSQNIRNTAADRIRASFDTTDKSPATGKALWGAVFGSRGSIGETDNTAKFKRSVTGILVGVDGDISNDWRVGALAGFSQSDYKADDRASSADADNYHLGLYGGTQWGAIGFRTGLAYT